MTDNEVREVLKQSPPTPNAAGRSGRPARRSGNGRWRSISRNLVKLRNQAASKLGFKNFHALQLFLNEQNGEQRCIKLFDELDELTRKPFHERPRRRSTRDLAKKCDIKVGDLTPWHYHDPFFQEHPAVFGPISTSRSPSRPAQAVPRLLRRHRPAHRPRHRAPATCTRRRAKARMPSAPTSTARAMSACWPTSCPTITGRRPCCTSSAIRSTAARTFPQRCPMCCAPRPTS